MTTVRLSAEEQALLAEFKALIDADPTLVGVLMCHRVTSQPQHYSDQRLVQFLGGRKWTLSKAIKSLAGFHAIDQIHGILTTRLDVLQAEIDTGLLIRPSGHSCLRQDVDLSGL